jgi:hypothetical protein
MVASKDFVGKYLQIFNQQGLLLTHTKDLLEEKNPNSRDFKNIQITRFICIIGSNR